MVFNRLVAFWIISSPLSFLSRKSFSKSWTYRHHIIGGGNVVIPLGFFPWVTQKYPSQCSLVPRPPPQFIFGFSYCRKQCCDGNLGKSSLPWNTCIWYKLRYLWSDMPNLPPPDKDLRSSCPLGQRDCTSGHSWRFGSAEIEPEREYGKREYYRITSLFVSMVTRHSSSFWDSRSAGLIPGLQKQRRNRWSS